MTIKNITALFFFFINSLLFSQNDEVLFSIDNNDVKTSEFLRVYNKNLDIVADKNQKEIKNYLDLYVNYKLKVMEARELGYDTLPAYVKELNTYKKQLMQPYLRDDEFIDKLVKEAYNRSLTEIKASHILINVKRNSVDTLQAYTKINEARKKIIEGVAFEVIAKEYSDDRSAAINGGDLGYFTAFSMVYPFENAAYATKIGEVSEPFKTRFGYHIIKVNDIRDARGKVEAAHIMIKGDSIASKNKIDSLYNLIAKAGKKFADVAKTSSEDKHTAVKGGSLGKFGPGKMVKEFEEVSFSLENEGDVSKPFKTKYGWHIIKLIKRYPVESFEEQKKELQNKVKRGDRASIVSNSIVYKIKDNYTIEVNDAAINPFKNQSWKDLENLDTELMTVNDKSVSQKDFSDYLKNNDYTNKQFEKFKEFQILEYYKEHLEETNPEYASIYLEYKEGLLLFESMQKRIWNQSKDSIGIQTYYDNNKSSYMLKEEIQPLEKIKGTVINDYQEYLEKQWIEELHSSYEVKINNKAVNRLIGKE